MRDYNAIRGPVVRWASEHYQIIQNTGSSLSEVGLALARRVGVLEPERIRVLLVDEVPIHNDPLITDLAKSVGMLDEPTARLTLGHSIYIARGCESARLYSHEFRHVYQYETYGSIPAFMDEYLPQVLTLGYGKAPLELDAQAFEIERV